ncbi:hypothetical protein SteCoe_15896 [Stentor coeruleus]|uniref:Aminopeptidase n=1 Tax=Stentor coeruleus TaxID=5963 RepID=A0A1R2C2N1_9CILI|nr:hypothetical protein SteCoe_15896 [Stentor coeruleus]
MDNIRLLPYCCPQSYNISLVVDISSLTYTGEESIVLIFSEPSSIIKLHVSLPVKITKLSNKSTGEELLYTSHPYDIIEIALNQVIQGDFTLNISFQGKIASDTKGFYASFQESETMLITHFEPTYARKAIPCFDEPGLKSKFSLQITTDSEYTVISNMPGQSISSESNTKTTTFQESPLMSCYLLHWTICKHSSISTLLENTEIRLYARNPSFSEDFLILAKDTLAYYNTLFSIPYPLPKIDLISVFNMSVRAMENWGCITFHCTCIEKLPGETFQKFFRDCRTLCHEISHMWFGNLVTMAWWNDLWLNEGFARFMEFKCLDKIRTQYRTWLKFITEVTYTALNIDFPVSRSHPVEILCLDPEQISKYFDSISYLKGASVLRMLEELMGEENFDNAIRVYLDKYKWKNVTSQDFFSTMSEFTKVDVIEIMTTWTQQAGFPLVTVAKIQDGLFKVTQKAYDNEATGLWMIPIKYVTDKGQIGFYLLDSEEGVIEADAIWIKINYQSRCFYRVLYEDNTDLLKDIKNLSVEDRYGFIQDTFAHYTNGLLDFPTLHKIIMALVPEYEYTIVNTIVSFIQGNLGDQLIGEYIRKMLEDFLMPLWDKYGYDGESSDLDFESLKKKYCKILLNDCKSEKVAKDILERVRDDPKEVDIYYKCLIVLDYLDEAKTLAETSYIFCNSVLISSNSYELIKRAFRLCLKYDKEDTEFEYDKYVFGALYSRHEVYPNDNFFRVMVDEYIETDNQTYREEIYKLIIIYSSNIYYKVPEIESFIEGHLEKLNKAPVEGCIPEILLECLEKFNSGFKIESNNEEALKYFADIKQKA